MFFLFKYNNYNNQINHNVNFKINSDNVDDFHKIIKKKIKVVMMTVKKIILFHQIIKKIKIKIVMVRSLQLLLLIKENKLKLILSVLFSLSCHPSSPLSKWHKHLLSKFGCLKIIALKPLQSFLFNKNSGCLPQIIRKMI